MEMGGTYLHINGKEDTFVSYALKVREHLVLIIIGECYSSVNRSKGQELIIQIYQNKELPEY